MKREIFGRKVGSNANFERLITSEGASSGGRKIDPEKLRDFEIEGTRRSVKMLQEKQVEGYVLFEGDSRQYEFSPNSEFVFPAFTGSGNREELR